MIATDPEQLNAPKQQARTSLFFRLPRELRDIVYELTLSERHGLVADVESKKKTPIHDSASQPPLRFNDITFIDTSHIGFRSACENFSQFISNCSANQLHYVRRVVLLDEQLHTNTPFGPTHRALHDLRSRVWKFCRNHPQATVVVRFEPVRFGPANSAPGTDAHTSNSLISCTDTLRKARHGFYLFSAQYRQYLSAHLPAFLHRFTRNI
jgi:hypothetical protein